MPVPAEIVCVDCGGRCQLGSEPPPDDDFHPGDIVWYRCVDCMDRWDLVVEEADLEPGRGSRATDW